MDIYSEIESPAPGSPGLRRKGTLAPRQASLVMRAIPAEDSAEERGSDSRGSDYGSQNDEEGEGQESEQDEATHDVASSGNQDDEREAFKKELQQKAAIKKEEDELVGPRLKKKIDDFIL